MKKIYSLFGFFALLFCTVFSYAQIEYLPADNDHLPAGLGEQAQQNTPAIAPAQAAQPSQTPQRTAPEPVIVHGPPMPVSQPIPLQEKILLFDVKIAIAPDAKITVIEDIIVNAQHKKIRRGIYRDIPVSWKEKVTPVELSMDGKRHPFFTENKNGVLRINFGNDDYISKGVHRYSLQYTFEGAIGFYKDHDELYWNVTGNDWAFPIDKARVFVVLPDGLTIQQDGVSLYTGHNGSKESKARQLGPLLYETTLPLQSHEGFTVAIPFNKGFFAEPPLAKRVFTSVSWAFWFFLIIFIILIVYFVVTWNKVGRDPKSLAITQYEPPQGISPAYMQYLRNHGTTQKTLACIFISLAMKGYIEIKPRKGFFSSDQADVIRTEKIRTDLPQDEALVMHYLFPLGNRVFQLKQTSAAELHAIFTRLKKHFDDTSKEYIVTNSSYLTTAAILVFILGVLPAVIFWKLPMLFINVHFSIFFLAFTIPIRHIGWKAVVGGGVTLFYSLFFLAGGEFYLPFVLCQMLFVLGIWGASFYHYLIQNVTEQGQKILTEIAGFERYMKTAEPNRFAASDPRDTEQIFCDYLPYAFALDMENKWMKKFENTLSKATIERCTACTGGSRFVSGALASSVSHSGGGGGGSHGGGCSGGGSGGGGGGGR